MAPSRTGAVPKYKASRSVHKNKAAPVSETPSKNVSEKQIEDLASMISSLNTKFTDITRHLNQQQSPREPTDTGVEQPRHQHTAFTFKDVEESLDAFDGEDGSNIESWLARFEETADVCNWSESQKFIYCRRLLKGTAKNWCEDQSGIWSYEILKNALHFEFKNNISTFNVHKMLENRSKSTTETFLEYAYAMKKIASQGYVDQSSLILYIIKGIPDSTVNKMILYEASTFEDLKRRIKLYENIKLSYEASGTTAKNNIKKHDNDPKRCINCGSRNHLKKDCPDLTKGPKCFNCNSFGHLSIDCQQVEEKDCNEINSIYSKSSYSNVKLNGLEIEALFDTGSKISVIPLRIAKKIKIDFHQLGPGTLLRGFADNVKQSLGTKALMLEVNNTHHEIIVNIVQDYWTTEELIIGRNFTEQVKLIFDHGTVEVYFKESEENDINIINVFEEDKTLESKCNHIMDTHVREKTLDILNNYSPRPHSDVESNLDMKIILSDEAPIRQKPRRLSPKERTDVNNQIEEWLKEGIIEYSTSDFSSPIVVVKKKDGSNRICVDYRKLNTRIKKDLQPMPIVEEILEKLVNSKVFTTLDLKNGFFHVSVNKDSRKYTSFVTPDGQYQFCRVPFGLTNSPGVFQRFINITLKPLIMEGLIIVYMDDIVIPSRTEEENVETLRKVCNHCARNGLIIKWSKCEIIKRQITFLGHIVENGSVKPSPEKAQAVLKFPQPRNIKDVQRFLGLTGYFRKFVPRYSEIARPLSDMLRQDQNFVFNDQEKNAFELLKKYLCEEPVLKLFDPKLETELHTDASINGFGGVLLQKHDDSYFHPVFYLSIHKCLKKLRVYLLGMEFKVVTDCKAFQQTMQKKDICPKIARWAIVINEFDCKIEHRKGLNMKHADALSRIDSVMIIEDVFNQQIQNSQNIDKYCQAIKEVLKVKPYEDFVVRNNILFKEAEGKYLFVIPKCMEYSIIKQAHDKGHFCDSKVKDTITEQYFIEDLSRKLKKISENCVQCILINRKQGKQECYLRPIEKLDIPLHTLHADHVGPLPSTSKNYNEVLVVVDAFTKFVWIFACNTKTTIETLKKIQTIDDVFGSPVRLITDKGSAFMSNEFKKYCEENNIIHISNTTGVPRGSGQVERINKTVKETLSKLSIEDPKSWYKFTTPLQKVLNSTVSRSTKRTPFELLFGVKMRKKDDLEINDSLEEVIIELFESERDELRKNAKQEILKIQEENKKQFDKKRKKARKYKLNDLVAIQRTQFGTGLKLYPKFLGPYQVVEVLSNDRYNVEKIGRHDGPNKTSTVADYMKPWTSYDEESSEAEDYEDGRI